MMRKYINKNYPDFTAEQRADGNYNLKKEGSYGYTIRIAKDIENNEDWVEWAEHINSPAKNNKTKTAMKCKHCNKELNNTLIDILLHEEDCIEREIIPSNNT